MLENLKKEVKATIGDNQCALWTQSLDPNSPTVLEKQNHPRVSSSFDTGWNQRGSLFNSPLSHSFPLGAKHRDPVGGEMKSRLCSTCAAWKKKNKGETPVPPTPEHHCVKNWTGTSGAMEAQPCVNIVERLCDQCHVQVDMTCMDDDTSTRSALKWDNATHLLANNATALPQVPIARGPNEGKLHDRPDKRKLRHTFKFLAVARIPTTGRRH